MHVTALRRFPDIYNQYTESWNRPVFFLFHGLPILWRVDIPNIWNQKCNPLVWQSFSAIDALLLEQYRSCSNSIKITLYQLARQCCTYTLYWFISISQLLISIHIRMPVSQYHHIGHQVSTYRKVSSFISHT